MTAVLAYLVLAVIVILCLVYEIVAYRKYQRRRAVQKILNERRADVLRMRDFHVAERRQALHDRQGVTVDELQLDQAVER